MGMRTVRLDDDAEAKLAALRKQTGLSISNVLKRGLDAFAKEAKGRPMEKSMEKPYEIFRRLEMTSDENAAGSAAKAKAHVVDVIKNKYGR